MTEASTIGFAGLSHLGTIYSMAAAARSFTVLAFDERRELTKELGMRQFPIVEPGLEETAREHGGRIRYTSEAQELAGCGLVFITLDVATNESNTSDLAPLEALIEKVSASIRSDALLAIMSQVPPGFCRSLSARLPAGLQLFHQVETLIFGNAMERAIHPERLIVGCADPAGELPERYRRYLDAFDCPVLPMRYESAELCKAAINCFLVSSVTTSNTLAEICERIGADWSEIVPALRLDKRIGPHAYLSPGLGIAGGNLERDLVTVQRLAAENGCDARVVTAWQEKSRHDRDWVLRVLFGAGALARSGSVSLAVWGLAYKAGTHSTRNSPSLALLDALPAYSFRAYDPVAKIDREFPAVRQCGSALEAAEGAAALIVMTPWNEFSGISAGEVKARMSGVHIVDPYRVLDGRAFRESGFEYHCRGA